MSTGLSERGKFITFEGIEGVGKTTNIQYAKELLEQAGHNVLLTREPGGTQAGEKIREILLSDKIEKLTPQTELLLLFAARSQHITNVILPALEKGIWVLCDRFTDASYAYQGGGRGIATKHIDNLVNLVQGELKPDYTLLLDVPVEVGLARAHGRGEADKFEQEQHDFFHRVHDAYLKIAKANPTIYKIIDASHDLETVKNNIKIVINEISR